MVAYEQETVRLLIELNKKIEINNKLLFKLYEQGEEVKKRDREFNRLSRNGHSN